MPIETNLVEIANYVGNLGPLFIISRFLWRCYKSQRALSTLRFSATISNTLLGYIIWWEITFLSTVPRHVYVFFNVFIKRDPFSGKFVYNASRRKQCVGKDVRMCNKMDLYWRSLKHL